MKKIVTIGVGAVFALGLAAGAMAGGGYGDPSTSTSTSTTSTTTTNALTTTTKKDDTFGFKASLNAAQEKPRPKAPAGAGGSFVARTVESKTAKTFTWKLSFHGLSGAAVAAHVHLGKRGVPGAVLISLCGPCKNGQTGKIKIAGAAEEAMEKGKAYVNVHTAKNGGGEIRGQIVLTGK
jgi:CHRD domain